MPALGLPGGASVGSVYVDLLEEYRRANFFFESGDPLGASRGDTDGYLRRQDLEADRRQ